MRNQFLRTLTSPAVQAEQVSYYGKVARRVRGRSNNCSAQMNKISSRAETVSTWRQSGTTAGPTCNIAAVRKVSCAFSNATQLAFGDYNGNRQLISTGNVKTSRRVALFLMDYRARERLKILGHAEVLAPAEAGDLVAQLVVPKGAVIERVFCVDVVGFDWNCPKYITPRFTAAEVEEITTPLQARIVELEAALAQNKL